METLVMTLPSAVTDETLKRIDEIRIEARSSLYFEGLVRNTLELNQYSHVSARITGDGHFTNIEGTSDLGKNISDFISTYMFSSIGDYNLFVGKKDRISKIKIDKTGLFIRLSELNYCQNLVDINIFRGEGDLADIANLLPTIKRLTLRNNLFTGDVGLLSNSTDLEYLMLRDSEHHGVLSFNGNSKLEYINIINSSGITADFDEIANGLYSSGKESGTLETYAVNEIHNVYTFTSEGWTKA